MFVRQIFSRCENSCFLVRLLHLKWAIIKIFNIKQSLSHLAKSLNFQIKPTKHYFVYMTKNRPKLRMFFVVISQQMPSRYFKIFKRVHYLPLEVYNSGRLTKPNLNGQFGIFVCIRVLFTQGIPLYMVCFLYCSCHQTVVQVIFGITHFGENSISTLVILDKSDFRKNSFRGNVILGRSNFYSKSFEPKSLGFIVVLGQSQFMSVVFAKISYFLKK